MGELGRSAPATPSSQHRPRAQFCLHAQGTRGARLLDGGRGGRGGMVGTDHTAQRCGSVRCGRTAQLCGACVCVVRCCRACLCCSAGCCAGCSNACAHATVVCSAPCDCGGVAHAERWVVPRYCGCEPPCADAVSQPGRQSVRVPGAPSAAGGAACDRWVGSCRGSSFFNMRRAR